MACIFGALVESGERHSTSRWPVGLTPRGSLREVPENALQAMWGRGAWDDNGALRLRKVVEGFSVMGITPPLGGGGLAEETDSPETSRTSQQGRQGPERSATRPRGFPPERPFGRRGKPVGSLFEAQPEVPVD